MINPDNPSGNYLTYTQLSVLIEWAGNKGIRLIVDESFADFADEESNSLLSNDILMNAPQLCVVKSISKSYGVPGLRLGILASGDTSLVDTIRKKTSIRNINSFAEFYMQITEKYKKDYSRALKLLSAERRRFSQLLGETGCLRVFPSQANYIMAELTNGMTAGELTAMLLEKNILIKDLSEKIKDRNRQLIRLAVRSTEDNDAFLRAFREICGI